MDREQRQKSPVRELMSKLGSAIHWNHAKEAVEADRELNKYRDPETGKISELVEFGHTHGHHGGHHKKEGDEEFKP